MNIQDQIEQARREYLKNHCGYAPNTIIAHPEVEDALRMSIPMYRYKEPFDLLTEYHGVAVYRSWDLRDDEFKLGVMV